MGYRVEESRYIKISVESHDDVCTACAQEIERREQKENKIKPKTLTHYDDDQKKDKMHCGEAFIQYCTLDVCYLSCQYGEKRW